LCIDKDTKKLKILKQFFKGWGFDKQGGQRRRRKELQNELLDMESQEEEGLLSLTQTNRKIQIQKDLLLMIDEEEIYWYKRAHGKWLHEEDNNTQFFS
jgi:hypothetical protein